MGGERPDLRAVARAQRVGRALLAAAIPGVADVVPGLRTVLVILDRRQLPFDPQTVRHRVRREAVLALGRRARLVAAGAQDRRAHPAPTTVAVRYGGDDGPDLEAVAAEIGLTPAAVVARHVARPYTVLALGFRPGFAFLGFLEPRLTVARRSSPRVAVPAGSVGIAGRQTGVYPDVGPGGWRLIGRTTLRPFDPSAATLEAACPLAPGARVQFTADPAGAVGPEAPASG